MITGNFERLRSLMVRESLAGLVAFTPQSMQYVGGYRPPSGFMEKLGPYSAIFATDDTVPSALVVGEFHSLLAATTSGLDDVRCFPMWTAVHDLEDVESGSLRTTEKDEQFDPTNVTNLIRDALADRKMFGSRVGCELSALPHRFRDLLLHEVTEVEWVDSSALLDEAMEVKTSQELSRLRTAIELAEFGLRRALLEQDIRGKSAAQLKNDYQLAVRAAVSDQADLAGFEEARIFLTCGGVIGPNAGPDDTRISEGSQIWVDVGATIDGYASDIGRTISVGRLSATSRRIADALEAGYEAGLEQMLHGAPMGPVFTAAQDAVRSSGLPWFSRGHYGHGIGLGAFERPSFIREGETVRFDNSMAYAYEVPYYVRGLGGFQFEDNFFVNDSGIERVSTLPAKVLYV